MTTDIGSSKLSAFHSVRDSILLDGKLPEQVFTQKWSHYFFCESDQIFGEKFLEVAKEFCEIEKSQTCCLVNFTTTQILEYQEVDAFFIEHETTEMQFKEKLWEKDYRETAWQIMVDRYACSSEVGEWCVYCEKENDVAIVAIKSSGLLQDFIPGMKKLWAFPIREMLKDKKSYPIPFSRLVPEWEKSLLENYG